MSRVLNIGSLNIDYVYEVPHFLQGGETLAATNRAVHIGGKGLNQSVALARAGLDVFHAGIIGADGLFLKDFLAKERVDVRFIKTYPDKASGHTFIQVTPEGENAILYYPGTNVRLTKEYIDEVLGSFQAGDILLLQNETSAVADVIQLGLAKKMKVIFNPSPFDSKVASYGIDGFSALVLNETEACGLLAASTEDHQIFDRMLMVDKLARLYPHTILLVTLGNKGVVCCVPGFESQLLPALKVEAVDTTGAGDTFLGYAVRALMQYWISSEASGSRDQLFARLLDGLRLATRAAAISVTKKGAAESIPRLCDLR